MSLMQWDGGRIRLMPGDCRDLISALPDASVDAVVTDPPYEIGFSWRTRSVSWDGSAAA